MAVCASLRVGKIGTRMEIRTAPPSEVKVGESATISGTLYDERDRPVGQATVELLIDGSVASTGSTSPEGDWAFSPSWGEPGTHTLRVRFPGNPDYEPSKTPQYTVSVVEVAPPTYTVTVHVEDYETGEPLDDATVWMDGDKQGKTGMDGNLAIYDVSESSHSFKADKPDYYPDKESVSVTSDTTVSLRLLYWPGA